MNRPLTALFAALEALLVVGIGIGIPLVPLTILWATQYGLQIDWVVFWRAAVDIWLLGNGADLRMTLDSATAASSGIPGSATPFLISIAPLGFALLTLLFGIRAGRRIDETPHPRVGILAAIVAFGILSAAATLSALHPLARPSILQGSLLPTLVFAIGIGVGVAIDAHRRDARNGWIAAQLAKWPGEVRAIIASSLRGGTAAVAAVTAVAGLLVAILLLGHYAQVITLYESAHAGVLGGVTLTVGQLAFMPNLVIWAASWLIGPGFAIGTGSSVSALGTSLGPLPAIPILGALPTGSIAFGFIGLLIPVVAGFLAGVVCRGRLLAALELSARVPSSVGSSGIGASGIGASGGGLSSMDLSTAGFSVADADGRGIGGFGGSGQVRWLAITGIGIGIVGGLLFALLASASAGAAGPGRLVDVGPSPWLVGLYAALEIGVAAIVGLISGGARNPK
ncbi:MAG: hypothetical protein QOK46_1773 [Microbacteriaceae bacterium]|nr:hypothetical protein [Microbacteriaceae bacterium]